MLKILCEPVGALDVNCYVVGDEASRRGCVIDPGGDADIIFGMVERAGIVPAQILLTHAHFDHIGAVAAVARKYNVTVWMHPLDRGIYLSPDNCMKPWFPAVDGLPPPDDAEMPPIVAQLGGKVIHTPGHTPGGVCYFFPQDNVLFSGDTLFRHSVGRTDFPGGNAKTLYNSIQDRLFSLPPQTRVLPGHEAETTIEEEIRDNPFV